MTVEELVEILNNCNDNTKVAISIERYEHQDTQSDTDYEFIVQMDTLSNTLYFCTATYK